MRTDVVVTASVARRSVPRLIALGKDLGFGRLASVLQPLAGQYFGSSAGFLTVQKVATGPEIFLSINPFCKAN